ncbi:hypothetical protein BD410DRAFT_786453, partial [Rickenella mellea]
MKFSGLWCSKSIPVEDFVPLPSIKSLSLTLRAIQNPDSLITSLLGSVALPNLTSLAYSLEHLETSDSVGPLIFAPEGFSQFNSLETVNIYDESFAFEGGILESILSACPSLLHLSLCLPKMSLYEGFCWDTVSTPEVWSSEFPLQTLSLRGCDLLSSAELTFLIFNIRDSQSWVTFRQLEVHGCKHLTENIFLSLEDYLEGKLVWTDSTI